MVVQTVWCVFFDMLRDMRTTSAYRSWAGLLATARNKKKRCLKACKTGKLNLPHMPRRPERIFVTGAHYKPTNLQFEEKICWRAHFLPRLVFLWLVKSSETASADLQVQLSSCVLAYLRAASRNVCRVSHTLHWKPQIVQWSLWKYSVAA